MYQDFQDFTNKEIRQHIGIYILHGLSPSPRVELKFKPQRSDCVHGNDMVYSSFGPNAERRHRHFKCFFACQNPAIALPSRMEYPNWKVRPLIKWLNFICPQAWKLAEAISIDEMTIGFEGNHRDKKRITYKTEGDGFQCNALCDNGFTYQVYFRNHPAPKKYLNIGMSPLHSRVLGLLDCVKDRFHVCGMDNLYNSVKFTKACYLHPMKVKTQGTCRVWGRGIPSNVIQKEVKSKEGQRQVRGIVKAAVLQDDPDCPDLVASSIYDARPVHLLSMGCNEIKWISKMKNVYNVDTGAVEKMAFLRLNQIDSYNNTMGGVDIADQLRGTYRPDHWLRNRKWWWAMWSWWLGVNLVNAYIMYVNVNMLAGKEKKDLMSHHDFRKSIALAWINPDPVSPSKEVAITRKGRGDNEEASVASSVTMSTIHSIIRPTRGIICRATPVNDGSMRTTSALSRRRLDTTLDHFLDMAKSSARCALHRWVGIELERNTYYCAACNVNLCIICNRAFHKVPELLSMKTQIKRRYEQIKKYNKKKK